MSTVRINRPEMGERQSVTLEADQSVAFAFNASVVSVDRVGNDLVVRFDNGAETSIQNFFVTDGKALPAFVLEDGTEIAGADLLRQLNDAMDIETAAGPSSSANDSGGAGEYDDGAGDLIDGVARLDALGTANWVGTTEAPESMLAASGEYGNSGNNTPVVPDGPGDYAPEDPVVPEEPGDDDPEDPVVPEEPGDDDPEDPVVPEEPGDDDPEEPVVPEEPGGDKPGNAVVDFAETNQVEFFDPGRSNYDDTNAWNLTDGWKTSNTTLIRTDSDDPNTVVITTKPAMSSTPTDLQKTFTAEEMGDGIRFKLQCKGTGAEDSLTITLNGKPVPVDFDENGFAYISIRSEDYAPADGGDYTLTFGLDNKGSSPHIVTVSDFVIGDVLEPPVWASGNVLANDDPSSGEDIVGSFILNGTLYTIDNDSPLSESGVPYVRVEIGDDAYFIMDAEGNYTYEGREASSHFPGPLDVTYTGTTGETTLHLRDNIVKAGEDAPAGSLLHGAGGEDALVANDAGLILEGRAGNDLLYGGAGDDILIGGSGSDILYGGDGRDTFTWGIDDLLAGKDSASDIIKDFDSAQDSIDLSELLSLGLQAEDINIIKDGDDIKLWFDNPVYGGRVQEIVIENLGVGIADQTSAEQMIQDMILQQQIKMITE